MLDDRLLEEQARALADALNGPNPITITADQADPPVLTLGSAIGLLIQDPMDETKFVLNPAWFQDPIGTTGDGLASGGPALAALIAQLIGQASGSSLGIPAKAPGNLGLWYPILNPLAKPDPKPTGLYIASTPCGNDGTGSVLGAGVLYQASVTLGEDEITSESIGLQGPSTIALKVWGLVPVVKMDGEISVAIGTREGPITMGFQVSAEEGESLVTTNGFAFTGVRLTCDLAFDPKPSVNVSLVIENLKLPTESVAKDYTLADLEAIGAPELLALVSALAMGALTRAVGDIPATGYLLPAVGLGPNVPGIDDTQLPILRWDQFAELAISGGDIARPIRDWFTTIAANAALLQAWLAAIGGLVASASGGKPGIDGTGTRVDPYTIPLFSIAGIGSLAFTVGTAVDADGLRHLYPGLGFRSEGKVIGGAATFEAFAALELMDFLLTPGGAGASLAGDMSAGLRLSGATSDEPLFSGTVGGSTYTFGSLSSGLNLLNAGRGITLLPSFVLADVSTPAGTYGSINLLNPNELVAVAAAELSAALTEVLNQLFGAESGTAGQSLSALLGISAPALKDDASWPADLAPPFGATAIFQNLQDPANAYTAYWSKIIASAEDVGGQKPLYYLLSALGDLITMAGVSPGGITGAGLATDPWLIALGPATSVIFLEAYLDASDPGLTKLTTGLAAASSLTLAGATPLTFLLNTGLLALTADGSTISNPTVFPVVAVTTTLPDGFTTPEVAGAALSVGASSLTLNWAPAGGWGWTMAVGAPALIVDGTEMPVGQPLNYSNSTGLEALVTEGAATFAPILTGVLGIALYRAKARAGLTLDAWFGLLPNLSAFMPEGIDWPADMPVLTPTSFDDPLGQIRAQFQAILSKPDQAQAALQLLGWAIDGKADSANLISGTGTIADPYRLPLGLPVDIKATLWQTEDLSAVTLGFAYTTSMVISDIVLTTTSRLDALSIDWSTGAKANIVGVPGLTVTARLTNSSGEPLVTVDGTEVKAVGAAVNLSLGDGFVVTANLLLTTDAGDQQMIADEPSDVAVVTTLVNAGFQAALPSLQASSKFDAVYGLLTQLGFLLPATGSSPSYGLDGDGWMALTSDGLSFLKIRFAAVLTDAAETAELMSVIAYLSGFDPPALPKPLTAVLTGLGLVIPGNGGAVLNPEGLVAYAQDPGGTLVAKLKALMEDEAARSLVMAELSAGFDSIALGPFTFTFQNGRTLTMALAPDAAIRFGGFASLTGSVALDLVSGDVIAATDLYIPQANAGLGTRMIAASGATPDVSVSLTWGDGSVPMPAPLQLWPYQSDAFITALSELAPAYALSVFISRVVEAKLLPDYPLARSLLQLFGLVHLDPVSETWMMKSALGLFENPVDWLLSGAVMGSDGTLNLAQIQSVLTNLPAGSAASGLTLTPTEMGATVSGLPYGLQVALTADPDGAGTLTVTPSITRPVPLVAGAELEALAIGLSLSAACQPGFSLTTTLTANPSAGETALSVSAGYDKAFALSFGQSGADKPKIQLLPFTGWSTLVPQLATAAAQTLLPELTDTLFEALEKTGAAELAKSLRTAGTDLHVMALVDALLSAAPDAGRMEAAALGWLKARLDPGNAAATAKAVVDLFSPYVGGLTSDPTGLVRYRPSPSIPVTFLAGVRPIGTDSMIGLWAESTVTIGGFAKIGLAPTGGGITLSGNTLVPSFGFAAQALIAGTEGPGLSAVFSDGFRLAVDPLMAGGPPSSLQIELFPQPFGVPASEIGAAVERWLLNVATLALPRYASTLVLNTAAVRKWLDQPLFPSGSTLTAAQVLIGSSLIVQEGKIYVLNSLTALQLLGINGFLAGFLKTLTSVQIKLLTLSDGGGIWVEHGPATQNGVTSYGLRVQAPDLVLPGKVQFVFQLGATDTKWIKLSGGADAGLADRPGLSLYVPIDGSTPHFDLLKVNLINIGVDFEGFAGAPLLDLARFKLGAVKPRGLLTLDFEASSPVTSYGGAFEVDDIQISLAPNTAIKGANVNPVAQNLMGSGSPAASGANPPVNPSFSVRGGWVNTGSLDVQFFDQNDEASSEIWIPVQRTFGPVHAKRIGVGWQNETDVGSVMFDGNLSLAGLSVELVDLSISVSFKNITDYSEYKLDLGGLAVSFSSASVSIAGGLMKQEKPLSYDGVLLVKFSTFSIYAVGSFTLIPVDATKPDGDTAVSFFAFLNINAPLGGVPAFFIEGLAGGFGINRGLVVPGAGNILSFPLIQGAISADYFGGDASPVKALAKMGDWVPPDIGSYWIAAGFKFSSFKLITVFTMLMVRFGREFEIDIIGLAQASLPPQLPPARALAYIELGVVASFRPDEGEISVTAQLTTNSFILTRSCKLTGGFAALFWFGQNPHAGDFVITLGGYNPSFTPPNYYPTVPRLGFNWPVIDTDAMSVKVYGGAYFALTPSMVMAGANMKATFEAGPLSAWFEAGANFLIAWQPFYYMAEIHISLGAALTVEALGVKATISAELGALLELWGPETAGRVKVDWYIISFTIPFGHQDDDPPDAKPLSWEQFVALMLPSGGAESTKHTLDMIEGRSVDAAEPVILTAQITTGLIRTEGSTNVVDGRPLVLTIATAIPATRILGTPIPIDGSAIGVRPMEVVDVTTDLELTLKSWNALTKTWDDYPIVSSQLLAQRTVAPSPGAMWSRQAFNPQGLPTADLIDGTLTGVTLTAQPDTSFEATDAMDLLAAFGYDKAPPQGLPFAATPNFNAAPALPQTHPFASLKQTVMSAPVVQNRTAIWETVVAHNIPAITVPSLSILATVADQIYVAPPRLAELAVDVQNAPSNPDTVIPAARHRATANDTKVESAPPVRAPRLLGSARAYVKRGQVRRAGSRSRPTQPQVAATWIETQSSGTSERLSVAAAPGCLSLIDLGTETQRVALDAGTRVRLVELDSLGRAHADRIIEDNGPLEVTPGTTQIALVGGGADGTVAGWGLETLLFQANLTTLIAPGCRLRLQASPRIRHRARELKRGLVMAADGLRRNRVQIDANKLANGWIETLFTACPDTVVIAHAGPLPKIRITERAGLTPKALGREVEPIRQWESDDGFISVFTVPKIDPGSELGVWLSDWAGILGVYSIAEQPEALEASRFASHSLPSFGVDLPRAATILSAGRTSNPDASLHIIAA